MIPSPSRDRGDEIENSRARQWLSGETGFFSKPDVYSVATRIVQSVERCPFLSWHAVNAEREPLSACRTSMNVNTKTAAATTDWQFSIMCRKGAVIPEVSVSSLNFRAPFFSSMKIDYGFHDLIARHRLHRFIDLLQSVALANHLLEREILLARF
jgi:hypothetical protein